MADEPKENTPRSVNEQEERASGAAPQQGPQDDGTTAKIPRPTRPADPFVEPHPVAPGPVRNVPPAPEPISPERGRAPEPPKPPKMPKDLKVTLGLLVAMTVTSIVVAVAALCTAVSAISAANTVAQMSPYYGRSYSYSYGLGDMGRRMADDYNNSLFGDGEEDQSKADANDLMEGFALDVVDIDLPDSWS